VSIRLARERINASIISLMLAFFCLPANAEDTEDEAENLLHYSYSAVFGSGYYKVGDRKVGIIQLPFSIRQRVAGEDSHYGMKWLLPFSFGLHSFNPDEVFDGSDRVSTVSFIPGLELHFPLPSGWQLRPYAQLGFAFDVGSSESATVYVAGLKARRQLIPLESERVGLTAGIKGVAAGYNPENANSNSLGYVAAGVDMQWPIRWRPGNGMTYVGLSIYGNYYYETVRFANPGDRADDSERELTVAVALGFAGDQKLFGVPFDRIGIGYKRGDDIRAILLVTDFPF
jgi:hypothetical protein